MRWAKDYISLFRAFHLHGRQLRVMPVVWIFAIWVCLYAGLRLTREPDANGFSAGEDKGRASEVEGFSLSENDASNGEATEDPLEAPCNIFNFPELTMSSLGVLVSNWGFRLEYPASARSLALEGNRMNGRSRAAILLDLLRPHGHGFCRQGGAIRVLPIDLKQTRKDRPVLGPLKSSRLRTELKLKAGEAADLWVESEPLIRLRIIAQPLYGETDTETEVVVTLEARRDFQPWFRQVLEMLPGQTASFEAKGRQNVWCLVTPKALESQIVTLEVDFYYEANLPIE